MTHTVEEIFAEAVELGERERASLAGLLIHSLEPSRDSRVDESWLVEIKNRIRAMDSGGVSEVPWEEVRARLWARFNQN
ncbi:MAG: addiction module protein [Rudaea sp.]